MAVSGPQYKEKYVCQIKIEQDYIKFFIFFSHKKSMYLDAERPVSINILVKGVRAWQYTGLPLSAFVRLPIEKTSS